MLRLPRSHSIMSPEIAVVVHHEERLETVRERRTQRQVRVVGANHTRGCNVDYESGEARD